MQEGTLLESPEVIGAEKSKRSNPASVWHVEPGFLLRVQACSKVNNYLTNQLMHASVPHQVPEWRRKGLRGIRCASE